VIAATNKDLEAAVREGTFRIDLYHRLIVHTIEMPPLRERREDIPSMVEHFVESNARDHDLLPVTFTGRAMEHLKCQEWSGNVRELEHYIEKIMVNAAGIVKEVDLDFLLMYPIAQLRAPAHGKKALQPREKRNVVNVLAHGLEKSLKAHSSAPEMLSLEKFVALFERAAKRGQRVQIVFAGQDTAKFAQELWNKINPTSLLHQESSDGLAATLFAAMKEMLGIGEGR
jgi:DNA-binding NtrC family response regulator